MHTVYVVLLWIIDSWPDLSAFVLMLGALFLGIFPGKVAALERNNAWRLAVPLLVGAMGISGFVEGLHQKGVFQGQIQSLSTGVLSEATKGDINSLTTHIDDGFTRVVDAITNLSAICKAPSRPQAQVPPPPTPLPPPILQNAHFAARRVPSTKPESPYALQVVVQTDIPVEGAALEIDFDQPIDDGDFFVAGQAVMMSVRKGITADHKGFVFSFGFPSWTPEHPIVVTVYSKQPAQVAGIKMLHF